MYKRSALFLGFYAAWSGSSLSTFWNNLSVPSSVVKQSKFSWTAWPLKKAPMGCPETSTTKYHSAVLKIREDRRYNLTARRKPEIVQSLWQHIGDCHGGDYPEDGGSIIIRSVWKAVLVYTGSHSRIRQSANGAWVAASVRCFESRKCVPALCGWWGPSSAALCCGITENISWAILPCCDLVNVCRTHGAGSTLVHAWHLHRLMGSSGFLRSA